MRSLPIAVVVLTLSLEIQAVAQDDVPFLTVTSTDRKNVVEFLNPPQGPYFLTRVIGRDDRFAETFDDVGTPAFLVDVFGTQGEPSFVVHTELQNGQTYFYTAFVFDGTSSWSPGKQVTGTPINPLTGIRWRFFSGTGTTAMSPPGIGSVLLVLSNDKTLYPLTRGLDGGTWAFGAKPLMMGGLAQHRPAVIPREENDNLSLIGAQDGFVRAVDADTGALLWTSDPFGMIQGGPSIWLSRFSGAPDDVVFVGSRNAGERNALHALDGATGATIWSFDDPGGDGIGIISGGASIDYVNGAAYFASHEFAPGAPTVWAVDLATGQKRWATPLGSVSGSPIQRGNDLYVGADDGRIHGLDVSDGSLKLNFPFPTGDGITKGFVFPNFNGLQIYASTQTTIWCLRDVEPVVVKDWSHPAIPGPSIPTYPPGSQFLWVGSSDGRLYQLDVTTGNPSKAPDTRFVALTSGSAGVGSPSYDVVNSLVYVGTEDGALYAVHAPF